MIGAPSAWPIFLKFCDEILQDVRRRFGGAIGKPDLAFHPDLDFAHRDIRIGARHALRNDGNADAGSNQRHRPVFRFRNGDGFSLVPVDTVDWIESANNYVVLHCGQKQHLMGDTLTNVESSLNPDKFLRIHRCRIVNVSRIAAVRTFLSGTYQLELHGGIRLTTGKQYVDAVRGLIKKYNND